MDDAPKITGIRAGVSADWALDIDIEPGSVPDRDRPYTKTGGQYRPRQLRLVFCAGTESVIGLGMLHPQRIAEQLRQGVRLSGICLSGVRLRQDGTLSEVKVTENFYGIREGVPDWALTLADHALASLTRETADQEAS